jgi:predicted DNA binding CopG/RHH family protein
MAARTELKIVTLRLRSADIRKAKAIAKRDGLPYQVLIRQWVAEKVREEQ